jgi:hypothetical protein
METKQEDKQEFDGIDNISDKLLEAIETQHRDTFVINNKRFVMKKGSDGVYFIDEDDELQSIGYSGALSILLPEIDWIYETSGDYQGEWVAVGKDKDGIWYYKRGSYGSCSGCDWYLGLEGKKDAIEYIKAMMLIDKVGNKEQLIEYLKKEKDNGWGSIKEAIDKILKHSSLQ